DSLDAQGAVTVTAPVPDFGDADLASAARALTGTTLQVPPMVSALKVGGERLHALARRGVEVERAPREVTVTSLAVERGDGDTLAFDVTCSAGTYVRVLVSDLAESLGTHAHLTSLRRVSSGRFDVADALTLGDLEAALERGESVLRPASDFVAGLASVTLSDDEERRVRQGQAIELAEGLEGEEIAALDAAGSLVAVLARRARTGRPELVLAPETPRTRG
ncbi:MAG: tRNA pseudouridine(55) synthase TruB, partial [Acidobacteriota bacterium]|nr:tRNA pseudouridine(55) synthase TruB [Acidobacteriota bacterium]